MTVFAAHAPPLGGRPPPAPLRYRVREARLMRGRSAARAASLTAPFVSAPTNLSLVVTVHDAWGEATAWRAGHVVVVVPAAVGALRAKARLLRAPEVKDYGELLAGPPPPRCSIHQPLSKGLGLPPSPPLPGRPPDKLLPQPCRAPGIPIDVPVPVRLGDNDRV